MSDKAKVHTTKLSVNVNKIATLRNARGGLIPDVLLAAKKIEGFGAQGITVHPRPDARHITYEDVRGLTGIVKTEFNIDMRGNLINGREEALVSLAGLRKLNQSYLHDEDYGKLRCWC